MHKKVNEGHKDAMHKYRIRTRFDPIPAYIEASRRTLHVPLG